MTKQSAKRIFRACVDCLPQAVSERVVRMHPRFAIAAGAAHGDYGFFRFAPTDTSILPAYARTGSWAKGTNDLLMEFFAAGEGSYFDIGANVGLTTIPVAARYPLVRCTAFEPEPENFAHLRENVRRNVIHGNVEIHRVAILEHRGTVRLGIADDNKGDHRVNFTEGGRRRVVDVPSAPLDSFDHPSKGPLAVKIDTQGAEPFVIKSGASLLGQSELVILEFWPHGMKELGGDPEIVIEFIGGFAQVAILESESDAAPAYQTARHACSELRKLIGEKDHIYVDVVARR
jgi:FkbM family methyltransferase